jgi:hypothetical protein
MEPRPAEPGSTDPVADETWLASMPLLRDWTTSSATDDD